MISLAYMQKAKNEVDSIRKTATFIFSLLLTVLVVSLSSQAQAADASSRAGAVTTSQGRLNVRSSPSAAAAAVTSLPKGSHITLIAKTGDWWKVEYAGGRYGYCHSAYITPIAGTPAAVATASGNLNVRAGAGTSYARVASLPKGTTVLVLTSSGGWSRVLYHGTKTGYVSSAYLANLGGYPAVSLAVPSYKQTDSRWAQTYIGTSGKTIAQIGCATTAVAMLESYRTGTTIYPDAMSKQLRYTASGSLYWPEDYRVVTDGSGLLSGIYAALAAGKPVLFGATNGAGKQHWVVINGYSGSGELTASNFTILDPGSNSRTKLQQLLAVYPVFYKYFTY